MILHQLADTTERIRKQTADAEVSVTDFQSGAAMIDLRRAGRLFVIAYSPSQPFGVDEVVEGEEFLTGYRFSFESLELATAQLENLWPRLTDRKTTRKVRAGVDHPIFLCAPIETSDDGPESKSMPSRVE